MIYFGFVFALVILAAVIYMALNRQSNRTVRIACLIALGVMILTIIICLFLILIGGKEPVDESILIVNAAPPPPKTISSSNIMIMLIFTIFLLALFIAITVMALRGKKKSANQIEKKTVW
jgi:cbb3-type cytochrome oxidase subunit 3